MDSEIIRLNILDRQLDVALQEALRKLEIGGRVAAPACHLWEDDKAFHVELAVPDWQPHHISLLVENNTLTIQGERSLQTFLRLVSLPAFVNAEKARAVHRDGVLTIAFPKRAEANARRILIEVA
jgi:HSP20 family protein